MPVEPRVRAGRRRGEAGSRRPAAEPSLESAKAVALRVLAFHARTRAQLRRRLARSGLAPFADEAIAWLDRLGYLDDAAYAVARARALLARRMGPLAAERRLVEAGIDGATARQVVRAALDERRGGATGSGELELCREALRTRLRGSPLDGLGERERARLARFLLGRGFSARVVALATGFAVGGDD